MSTSFWFLLCLTVLAIGKSADASQASGNNYDTKEESDLTRAFRGLFLRALGSKGTYHRYLLVSSGVVPPPENYEIPKVDESGHLTEKPLTYDVFEHFRKHTTDVLSSRENLSSAINLFFREQTVMSNQESKGSRRRPPLPNPPPEAEPEIMIQETVKQATTDSPCINDFFSNCPVAKENTGVDPSTVYKQYRSLDAEYEHASTESSLESVSGITSDYMKFLTNGLASSISSSAEDETKQVKDSRSERLPESIPSVTKDYIDFLRSESAHFSTESPSPVSTEFVIEQDASEDSDDESVEIETDLSDTTQFIPILPADYIEFLSSESSVTPSTENIYPEATVYQVPIEVHTSADLDTGSGELNFDPKSKLSSIAYSPLTGELLSVDKPYFKTAEPLKHWLYSSPKADSTKSDSSATSSNDFLPKKQNKTNYREGRRRNIVLGPEGGPLGQVFPNLPDIPHTNFTCDDKLHIPGFYADNETHCQSFHVCWPGRRETFMCPWGMTFSQEILSCDWWDQSVCAETVAHYEVNSKFKENLVPMFQGMKVLNFEPQSSIDDGYIRELLSNDIHFAESVEKHNLTQFWAPNKIPVKVILYEYPHPDFDTIFHHKHPNHPHHRHPKSKRSEDGTNVTSVQEEVVEGEGHSRRQMIVDVMERVLREIASRKSDSVESSGDIPENEDFTTGF